jgi:hypothetical protein
MNESIHKYGYMVKAERISITLILTRQRDLNIEIFVAGKFDKI